MLFVFLFLLTIFANYSQEPPKKRRRHFSDTPNPLKRASDLKLIEPKNKKVKIEPIISLIGKVRVLNDPQMLAPKETIERLYFITSDIPCVRVSAMSQNATCHTPNDWNSDGHRLLACDEENDLGIGIFPRYLPLAWFENKKEDEEIKFLLILPNQEKRLIILTCAYYEFYNCCSTQPETFEGYIAQYIKYIQAKKKEQKKLLQEAQTQKVLPNEKRPRTAPRVPIVQPTQTPEPAAELAHRLEPFEVEYNQLLQEFFSFEVDSDPES